MQEIILEQYNVIIASYTEKLLPVFFRKITEHHEAVSKIAKLQKTLIDKNLEKEDRTAVIAELHTYKNELEILVSGYFSSLKLDKEVFFNEYYTALNAHLETADIVIIRTQDKERFYSLETDSKFLKCRKFLKRSLFKLTKTPVKTANLFRKTKKEVIFWKQVIPLKNTTDYYFKSELINSLEVVVDAIYKEISEITNKYCSIDQGIDAAIEHFLANDVAFTISNDLLFNLSETATLNTRIENQKVALLEIFEATFLNYNNALYKGGTIELSASFFKTQKINSYQDSVLEKIEKDELLWQNTFSVFKSDWELDIEIFKVIFKVMFSYRDLENSIYNRTNIIKKELEDIKQYITDVKGTISGAKTNTEIKKCIASELKSLNKNFKNIIEETTTRINNQEIPLQINSFEESAFGILKSLSTKRAISTDNDYLSKTTTSSINYISPYELVTYQSWPSLRDKIKESKLDLSIKVTNFIDDINALSQVIEFNLESALSLFENTDTDNTPKKVALEGLDRSEKKIEDLKIILENLNAENSESLLLSLEKFNKSILALTDTENILEIRLTIAKAKSIEKSKLLKEKIINNVKNFIPIAILFLKTKYNKIEVSIKNLLLRAGLYKETTAVNSDLSNFLKQAEKALDALPYVYQRLFRSETLQNEALFIGRGEALETLQTAKDAFDKNNYSPTLIVGERGSGKTSLIHYFLNKNKKIKNIVFLASEKNISEPNEFIAFLNSSFGKDLDSLEDWIQFFNSGKKRTIILENIHYLYFRRVGGFNVLHQLATLISATKNNVFWMLTSAKYAFQYLNKTIQISELFAFIIEINENDKETTKEALIKRHKISGYNLYFEKPPIAYLSNKFLKSTQEVQQNILKEEFFSDINRIAQSNFRIAFMYWIRSTVKVSGSTIYMRSLKTIDTSFLNKISPVKLLLLNSILLNERLTMTDIVALSSLDAQRTQNTVQNLLEKGLLTIDDEEFYTINIFLYRQITSLLKSKNVIH